MTDTLPPLPEPPSCASQWGGRESEPLYTADQMRAYAAAAVAAERKKIQAVLKERLDGTVISKYISKAECEAARSVLRNAMLDTWGV